MAFRRKVTPEIEEKLANLVCQGLTDGNIAKTLALNVNTVAKYRKKLGLSNETAAVKHKERLALYQQGLNDTQIARELGCSAWTICLWRKKHGLEPNRLKSETAEKHNKRLELYQEGLSDKEIAAAEGCVVNTIAKWRKDHDLSRHKKTRSTREKPAPQKKATDPPRAPGPPPRPELQNIEPPKPQLPALKAVIIPQEKCVVIQQAVRLREGALIVVVDRAGGGKKAAIYQGTVRFVNTNHFTVDIGGYTQCWQWSDVKAGIVRIA